MEKIQGPFNFARHVSNFLENLCTNFPSCWRLKKEDESLLCLSKMVGLYHMGVIDFAPKLLFGRASTVNRKPRFCQARFQSRFTFRKTSVNNTIQRLELYLTNKESSRPPTKKTNYIVAVMIHEAIENSGLKASIEMGVGCGTLPGQRILNKLFDVVQDGIVVFPTNSFYK